MEVGQTQSVKPEREPERLHLAATTILGESDGNKSMEASSSDSVVPSLSILLSRGLLYLIIVSIVGAIIWASLARVSVVVAARGHLAPRSEPARLSIPGGGIVSAVLVQVGAKVHAGQALIALDSFRESAEVERIRKELDQTKADADGYQDSARILAGAADDIKQELGSSAEALNLDLRQTASLQEAYNEGAVALYVVQSKQAEVARTQAQIGQFRADLNRAEAEGRKDLSTALGLYDQIKALTIELNRDIQAKDRTVLTAPVAGTVTYVNSLRPGRYLAASDLAATIVPDNVPLLAEIWIPNPSIRRVRPALRARMKLDAYPYQQFGLLSGTLISVDPDADDSGAYRAWIRPDSLILEDTQGLENMRTGLALTAEIEVERRTVMSILLDPFRRLREGFHFLQ